MIAGTRVPEVVLKAVCPDTVKFNDAFEKNYFPP